MKCYRSAGAAALGLLIIGLSLFARPASAAPDAPPPGDAAPLFRVFLKDGTSLVSYGELARVGDRVVFSMPTTASATSPALHLVQIASARVDWERTVSYTESARATRYIQTRGEKDFALLSADIAQALNDVGQTSDPSRRLAVVERARRTLAEWPPAHYNYKQDEVRQMLATLDEAIAELRAAAGGQRFDLSLVAARSDAAKAVEPLLPSPTEQEVIEQTLAAARLTESAAERMSLLSVAAASLDRAADVAPEWLSAARASTTLAIERERAIDRVYTQLSETLVAQASARARAADVRGVQRVLDAVRTRDEALGSARPDTVNAILASVEEQLGAARRLRLARDRWALRLPELRKYRDSMRWSFAKLLELKPALEDIKTLAGSSPDAIGAILRVAGQIRTSTALVTPPDEFRELHGLLVSAAQMADSAARVRREAALTNDMDRAWNASSAAAGALMLSARARTVMATAFRLPQLPR